MDDGVDFIERALHRRGIRGVAPHESHGTRSDVALEIPRFGGTRPVHLWIEVVENGQVMTTLDERIDEM
jgi:hypothetical protein